MSTGERLIPVGEFELNLKGRSYKFLTAEGKYTEQEVTEFWEAYAKVAPECGYCEEIIFPGQAVGAGGKRGTKFNNPDLKETEYVHFKCVDEPGIFMGWINDEGQLESAFPND